MRGSRGLRVSGNVIAEELADSYVDANRVVADRPSMAVVARAGPSFEVEVVVPLRRDLARLVAT